VTIVSPTLITATLHYTVVPNTLGRSHTISLINNSGPSNALPFTLIFPTPSLTSMTATVPFKAGTSIPISLIGRELVFNPTVNISGTGVTVTNLSFPDRNRIFATCTIDANATTGPRTVSVTTSGGTTNLVTITVVP
jgi:hypothetical protein